LVQGRSRQKGLRTLHPAAKSRKIPPAYDKALYKQRHGIENMFAKLKDWHRV